MAACVLCAFGTPVAEAISVMRTARGTSAIGRNREQVISPLLLRSGSSRCGPAVLCGPVKP